jgi:hypothetical protein
LYSARFCLTIYSGGIGIPAAEFKFRDQIRCRLPGHGAGCRWLRGVGLGGAVSWRRNGVRVAEQIAEYIVTFSRAILNRFLGDLADFRIDGPPVCAQGARRVLFRAREVLSRSSKVRARSANVRANRVFEGVVVGKSSRQNQVAN